jgi:riboflavin synthase
MTGHVDGIAEIRQKIESPAGIELHLSLSSELLRYLVPKGSIALDGISLTIADLRNDLVVIYIVPQTVRATTLSLRNVADRLNVEVDLFSKYIEKHLNRKVQGGITDETMMKVGFLPMGWIEN